MSPEVSAGAPDRIRQLQFLDELGRYELFLDLYRSEKDEDRRVIEDALTGEDFLLKMLLLQYLEEIPEPRALGLILGRLEDRNEAVRKAAGKAYDRSGYPRKNLRLRPYVMSRDAEAARFAIRTLSRAGDKDILPALLSALPEVDEKTRLETLDGLRCLPDPRSIPHLTRYSREGEERERYYAVRALVELKAAEWRVPLETFLARMQDPSARVRRAAMLGLQRFPLENVASLFLDRALDKDEPLESRRRAIQALAVFPSVRWVAPLVRLSAADARGPLRLTTEITLKRFPDDALKKSLTPLLEDPDAGVSRQAAFLLAEALGHDPGTRARLKRLWEEAEKVPDKLKALEVLGELGGSDLIPLLLGALKENQVLGYSALGALNRLWTYDSGPKIMELLRDAELPQFAKQALLSTLLKRGPDESVREELLPWLLKGIQHKVMNIRYLCLQLMDWYPLSQTLDSIFGLLVYEEDDEVIRMSYEILLRKVGANPIPLVSAAREYPERKAIQGHLVRMLGMRRWGSERAFDLLYGLMLEPMNLPAKDPGSFISLCVSLLGNGTLALEKAWLFFPSDELRHVMLRELRGVMSDVEKRFPPLPLDFLAFHLAGQDAAARALLYDIVGLSGQREGIPLMTGWLLKETDEGALRSGRESLGRLIREGVGSQ